MNHLEFSLRFKDQWVVLDGQKTVLDYGPELKPLWDKHAAPGAKRTFYFAAADR